MTEPLSMALMLMPIMPAIVADSLLIHQKLTNTGFANKPAIVHTLHDNMTAAIARIAIRSFVFICVFHHL